MFRGTIRTLDIALLIILFIVSLLIGLMLMLPEPPPAPEPTASPTASITPTATPTFTPTPPRTPRITSTSTTTPSPTPTATPIYLTPTPRPTAPPGSTTTPLPLVAAAVPLPRSGLFIRRHNDYSAPSTVGIEALLRDGLTINSDDQSLPPIAPLSGAGISGPRDAQGEDALRLRYGLTHIPLTTKRDLEATHYLEIALRARDGTASETTDAPTVNYIFVVDTSGSMAGARLRGAQAAMRALFAEMRPQDTIGIVDFDNETRLVLPATAVVDLSLNRLNQALGRLVAQGGTDINLGLLAGIEEAARHAQANTLSHAFLFSDGEATDGVTEWLEIRRNLVVAVGDANIRMSTFAFGEDANARELDVLAGVTGGTYTFVNDPAAVGAVLASELARRDRLIGKDIRLSITLAEGVDARVLFGHDQVGIPIGRAVVDAGEAEDLQPIQITGDDLGGMRIVVPDIAAGETYWIVFEIAVPPHAATVGNAVGDVELTYVDTATARSVRTTEALTLGASGAKLPDNIVIRHGIGAWTSDVVFYALDDLLQDDLTTAAVRLTKHRAALEAAYADLTAGWLQKDVATLTVLATFAEALDQGGLPRTNAANTTALLRYGLEAMGRAQSGVADLGE